MTSFDVMVIGSGGGTKIAQPAAALGLRVALIEEDAFGGTCLNRGCIPSKMLIHPAELARQARQSQPLGITIAGTVQLAFDGIMERIIREVDETSAVLERRHAETPGITLFRGHATFAGNRVVTVNGERLTAPRVFIAVGSRPDIPPIPGLAETPFITSREALRLPSVPKRLLVLGAGYIAAELGGAYSAYGAEVCFLVRSRFLRGLDEDLVGEFERVFARDHQIRKPFFVDRVTHDGALFSVHGRFPDGRTETETGDALLVATGVVPNTDRLGLEHTAIHRDAKGYIRVGPTLETDVAGVYALGDCIGHYLFRHTANAEGEYLMRTAFSDAPAKPIAYGPVPYAVFTTPQMAGVGRTEADLIETGTDYVAGRSGYAESTPGMARVSDHGRVKVLVDRHTRRLLGAHIVGEEAATMIHLFIAAMKTGGTLDDLLGMIFIHPALPEVARDAIRDAGRQLD